MTASRQRARTSLLGRGSVTLTVAALLLGAGASVADAAEDDPDAGTTTGETMVITVDVPEHVGAASPSPTATAPQAPAGALPATGDDVQRLLPWLLGALAVTGAGAALAARRRRA
ncbi:LPXTG cell wall anchor domain-containing protein [Microbacterium sp. RG1]|uniref:LPXTG cell wall anchor domain-containing protein n=1 Tax=Microbacterium sp. RG1 TaxID=2489212 RepID=UPI0010CA5E46|nr:LPXTG cell wall anchor domain-containing protein [Microbacterium sp. RG1]QCQ16696.1 LPXTG cell wall anchor domain-containing protein [Microbacterium sp. RG1]